MHIFKINSSINLWFVAFLLSAFTTELDLLYKFFIPLLACTAIVKINNLSFINNAYIPYFLFFSISITSFLGFTETLTGSHAESSNMLLFGLSFYTASLAFYAKENKSLTINQSLNASNPLLLPTGPIALFIKNISYKSIKNRINYYLPFMIVGLFFFKVIASPLTQFLYLLEFTDLSSVIFFGIVFELFVYMNFCGLSLLIYGLFGIIGFKIPLNFKQPFSSRNLIEFWKGWHTSLSAVLKKLFYIPLRKKSSQLVALFGVYISSALWHGVTANFLLWGLFHASIFYISLLALKKKNSFLPLIYLPFAVIFGRVLFADSNTERLFEKLTFNYEGFNFFEILSNAPNVSLLAFIVGIMIVFIEFLFKDFSIMRKRNYKFLRTPIALSLIIIFGIVFITEIGIDYAVYGQR